MTVRPYSSARRGFQPLAVVVSLPGEGVVAVRTRHLFLTLQEVQLLFHGILSIRPTPAILARRERAYVGPRQGSSAKRA